jgi:hypothetical protein
MTKKSRTYEIVPLGAAAKRRAAERAGVSPTLGTPADQDRPPAPAAPSPALVPVPGDTPAVGYVWVGRELVRIGRDDTKTFGERRPAPFRRGGG